MHTNSSALNRIAAVSRRRICLIGSNILCTHISRGRLYHICHIIPFVWMDSRTNSIDIMYVELPAFVKNTSTINAVANQLRATNNVIMYFATLHSMSILLVDYGFFFERQWLSIFHQPQQFANYSENVAFIFSCIIELIDVCQLKRTFRMTQTACHPHHFRQPPLFFTPDNNSVGMSVTWWGNIVVTSGHHCCARCWFNKCTPAAHYACVYFVRACCCSYDGLYDLHMHSWTIDVRARNHMHLIAHTSYVHVHGTTHTAI